MISRAPSFVAEDEAKMIAVATFSVYDPGGGYVGSAYDNIGVKVDSVSKVGAGYYTINFKDIGPYGADSVEVMAVTLGRNIYGASTIESVYVSTMKSTAGINLYVEMYDTNGTNVDGSVEIVVALIAGRYNDEL